MSILPHPQPVRQAVQKLADFWLPGSCLLCGGASRKRLLCAGCEADLPLLPAALCPQCSEPTTFGERCGSCLKTPPHFTRTWALYRYEFPADRLIHALKYGHQLALAQWLGEKMAERLSSASFDLIIPLPLHPERLRERGFNQSVEIARTLARRLQRPLLLDALLRTRATPRQALLPLKERQRNVRGAFECRQDLSGYSILLIDDVITSGATLNECARVLKLHGATRVEAAVSARALKT